MVQPACLPQPSLSHRLYETGVKTILSGWGELDPKGEPTHQTLPVCLPVCLAVCSLYLTLFFISLSLSPLLPLSLFYISLWISTGIWDHDKSGRSPDTLQAVSLPIVDTALCNERGRYHGHIRKGRVKAILSSNGGQKKNTSLSVHIF